MIVPNPVKFAQGMRHAEEAGSDGNKVGRLI